MFIKFNDSNYPNVHLKKESHETKGESLMAKNSRNHPTATVQTFSVP